MTGVFEFIELYLIRDLKSMRSIRSDDGLGKCGYQMMVSICTGCELLGSIEKNDLSENSEAKFKSFINKHLPNYNLIFPAALPRGSLKEGAETLGFCNN